MTDLAPAAARPAEAQRERATGEAAVVRTQSGKRPRMALSWKLAIALVGLVVFVLVHMLMVALVGPVNEIWSMITGRYRLPAERH